MRQSKILAVATLIAASAACTTGRYSAAAFHLPSGGDATKGQAAFLELGCHSCHTVYGAPALPKPTAQQPVVVVLGGDVTEKPSDAYLVTSMIDPSYALASYPKEWITADGRSRMPGYADRLTGRQMTDLVAFLNAHYTISTLRPGYMR